LYLHSSSDSPNVETHHLDESLISRTHSKGSERKRQKLIAKSDYIQKQSQKLRYIGLFYLVLSTYIILNDAIGMSSAPYYILHSLCVFQKENSECQQMQLLTSILYAVEMLGGFLLAFQASSMYMVVDHPK